MKKAVSLLLSLALLTSAALAGAWPSWATEAETWAEELAFSDEFMQAPEQVVTRAMAAQLLYEAAGRPDAPADQPFSDVTGPYADAIAWAASVKAVDGIGDGKYNPDAPVQRQEFAAILYRQAGRPQVVGNLGRFKDTAKLPDWSYDALLWCVRTGLMAGRSVDLLAPTDQITTMEAVLILKRAAELSDTAQMLEDLNVLTAAHRPIGSDGEAAAAKYLQSRFEEMGYTVTLQSYTDAAGKVGTNVIATRAAQAEDADILVLSAHHDSVPTAYGANDNASGVAALLAVADALKDLPTDTELRFISFTDEESGKNGSRFYTASLTDGEKSRMIGDIQLDMLGGLGSDGTLVCTTDGEANWVSDLLREKNSSLSLAAETASDHAAFQLAGVPSVLVMQDGRGYLYHSAADTADQLDLWAIAGAVCAVVSAAEEIMSLETDSYRELARSQGDGYTYRQTRQNVIYFESSLADTEAYVGAAGELVDQKVVEGTGWKDIYDTYLYSMRWFGGDEPMNTYYQYRNGFLQSIEVRPAETGYTFDQVQALLSAMYGEPTSAGENRQGQPYQGWQDTVYSKYITLTGSTDGYTVSVGKYNVGISNTLATYEVVNGEAEITDPKDQKVWNYLCSILPLENRQKITQFQLFTDGASGILAYTAPIRDENGTSDNTQFSISVDYYDVYDENGNQRDWSKLTYTILHEYGHVLLEDETQIDLSLVSTTHDPAGFVEGSFRKAFYDKFWAHLDASGVGDYDKDPTRYVSRYGANYFHEDIADTFAVFLLGGKPQGDTVAEEKLLFFWDDPAMVNLRIAIRQNLGLEQSDTTNKQDQPESPAGPLSISDMAEISTRLADAIANCEQPPVFDVSALTARDTLELDVCNAYFSLLSQYPEYKYAYDLTPQLDGTLLTCVVSYMPYRTGTYPAEFQGIEVDSLAALIRTAQENLDQERFSIRITDRSLAVDDMNMALQQVGGGYLLCQLSRDGTAVTVTPQNGLSHQEALDRLAAIDTLADAVYQACVTPEQTDLELAQALYTWLTEQVRYDFRYYSDRTNMPFESTTAFGALKDHLAICGGYAQALQALFQWAGIPCVTISGKLGNEYHMWNIAQLDGQWRYFDATSDRGRANYWFNCFHVDSENLDNHTWDLAWAQRLTDALS